MGIEKAEKEVGVGLDVSELQHVKALSLHCPLQLLPPSLRASPPSLPQQCGSREGFRHRFWSQMTRH